MNDNEIDVAIVGLGYVGLPTLALAVESGLRVHGVDIDVEKINDLKVLNISDEEPGVLNLIANGLHKGNLTVSTEIKSAKYYVVCVPTPFMISSNNVPEADLTSVMSAVSEIVKVIKGGQTIIIESTCPVGTTERIFEYLTRELIDPVSGNVVTNFHLAYCPERVLPGNALEEIKHNNRVIGGVTPLCSASAAAFYHHFVEGKLAQTNAKTAELTKLVENSYRDTQIAFANEIHLIADSLMINVWELIDLANMHPRVEILKPGPGVGGHCLAVDPWFVVAKNPNEAKLIKAARLQNEAKPDFVIEKVKLINGLHKNPRIVCLGLSYKPNVGDLRESPSLKIFQRLSEIFHSRVYAVEPNINQTMFQNLLSLDELDASDLLVYLVDHEEFKDINISKYTTVDMQGVSWSTQGARQ